MGFESFVCSSIPLPSLFAFHCVCRGAYTLKICDNLAIVHLSIRLCTVSSLIHLWLLHLVFMSLGYSLHGLWFISGISPRADNMSTPWVVIGWSMMKVRGSCLILSSQLTQENASHFSMLRYLPFRFSKVRQIDVGSQYRLRKLYLFPLCHELGVGRH